MGHDIVSWQDGEDQGKICYEGPCAIVKGKLEAQDMMNRQGSKVRVEAALVPMDQGNGEEQARL
jgi:hypothetical protein